MTWSLAPSRILALAAIFALLLMAVTYLIATHQPWLGLEFTAPANQTGLQIARVHPLSPNQHLKAGDIIVALASTGHTEPVSYGSLPAASTNIPDHASYNRFVSHHEQLWRVLTHNHFEFVMADGRRLPGQVHPTRSASDLSFEFWFMLSCALITFLIGVAIWAFRTTLIASRILLVSACGFTTAALLASAMATRELTLSPFWFRHGLAENNVGIEALTYSLVALLWYYPSPLSRFPFAAFITVYAVVMIANEKLQLVQWPLHAYVAQYLVAFAVMIVLALFQWQRSRHEALARASLQWFLLTILVIFGAVVALFFVPIAYTGQPILPTVYPYAAGPLLLLGLALGIARYRLFDLERWWLEVWLWLGGGLLVIGIDVLLITFFHLADLLALGFALILAGWVYLPLRQWLFRRVLRPSRTRLDDHFPLLIETLFQDGPATSFGDRWRHLLERVFMPMTQAVQPRPATQTALAESGLALQVPSFDGHETYELRYREQGRRLYTPRDASLADSLLALMRRAAQLWQQREEGAKTERARIMRDLHDDVAARLLTLAHRAKDPAQQQRAREALASLRQVIYALDDAKPVRLGDFLNETESQVRERLRATTAELHWHEPADVPEVLLTPRERINFSRVVQEAITNALRHAKPERVTLQSRIDGRELSMQILNDGTLLQPEEWQPGKGLHNIRTRMAEIGGSAQWSVTREQPESSPTCSLTLTLPLKSLNPA